MIHASLGNGNVPKDNSKNNYPAVRLWFHKGRRAQDLKPSREDMRLLPYGCLFYEPNPLWFNLLVSDLSDSARFSCRTNISHTTAHTCINGVCPVRDSSLHLAIRMYGLISPSRRPSWSSLCALASIKVNPKHVYVFKAYQRHTRNSLKRFCCCGLISACVSPVIPGSIPNSGCQFGCHLGC
jgi:hypothetical protein